MGHVLHWQQEIFKERTYFIYLDHVPSWLVLCEQKKKEALNEKKNILHLKALNLAWELTYTSGIIKCALSILWKV